MDSAGWRQHGLMVNYYGSLTPPHTWPTIGLCWANTSHAVVPLRATAASWVAALGEGPSFLPGLRVSRGGASATCGGRAVGGAGAPWATI